MRAFFILKDTVSRNDIQLLSKHNVVFSDTFLIRRRPFHNSLSRLRAVSRLTVAARAVALLNR
jgi:hypothetical protein